jgi:hypothetical protein
MNTNSFRVIINGLCTPVTSNFATLYVNPLPTISLAPSGSTVLIPGDVLNINAVVNPLGGSFVWYKNGTIMPPPSPSNGLFGLTVDNVGTYKVVYTDLNGCVMTSSDIVVSLGSTGNLYVYPVPNHGVFQIRFQNQANEKATVNVYDAKGSRVYTKAFTTQGTFSALSVDLGDATADGIYVVEVVNGGGTQIGSRRIMVNKK